MDDQAKPQEKSGSGRSAYRKIWWLRFLLPPIALIGWWYFAGTAVQAYDLGKEGVVVSGEVTDTKTGRHKEYMDLRFTTSDGRQVETTVTAPKSCGMSRAGDKIEVRYLPSDPHVAQDACDSARYRLSWVAFLVAAAMSAASVQAWRLWLRHKKSGRLPADYQI